MDISTLENWLWEAACSIRGSIAAPQYKDYILPLLFYKRLSDMFEDELDKIVQELGDREKAYKLAYQDRNIIRFFIPQSPSPLNLWTNYGIIKDKLFKEE